MKETKLEKQRSTFKRQKGITLMALVVTIVILIILATVAIGATFGENGLIKRAEEAKDMTEESTRNEEQGMTNAVVYMNETLGGSSGSGIDEPEKSEVEEAIENRTEYADTTPIIDAYENIVYVPGGFRLAEDSGTSVEDGIVIEDMRGNQFVWIPVGTYKVSSELSETGILTNNLSRRTFTSSGATEVAEDDRIKTGLYYCYGEGNSSSIASGTIGAFKTNATIKGGFYIGRYEQGSGNICKSGIVPYTNVTRNTAKSLAESMYSGNSNVVSELISSYAWDTTLNFICQTNSAGYVLATTSKSIYGNIATTNRQNTGIYSADKYSNIHDLIGNCQEWTTEYGSNEPCVRRGGHYVSQCYACIRYTETTSTKSDSISFRVQLYVKNKLNTD